MPYARLDDRWDDHTKIRRAWRRQPVAVALHAMAITYCNRHNNDGKIEVDWVEEKLALLPCKPAQQARILATLLELRLLELYDAEYYLVHDFLDWNLSSEQREELAERGRRGGLAKSSRSGGPKDDGSGPGSSRGLHDRPSGGSSTPRHATPTPLNATTSAEKHPEIAVLCRRLAERISDNDAKADPKPDSERWLTDMRLLVAERDGDVAEVARIIDWSQANPFWRSNILSPAKLRKQFTQLVLKAGAAGVVRPLRPDNADALIRKLRAAEEAS